jgi:hypothetical protein
LICSDRCADTVLAERLRVVTYRRPTARQVIANGTPGEDEMTKKAASACCLTVLAVLVVTASASAQLAKQGSYSAHYGYHNTAKVTEMEKDHVFVTGENIGTVFNDSGRGFLHAAAVVCPLVVDNVKNTPNAHGYCVATDADGDKAFLVWKCKSPQPGARCEGDFQWTGGTGKYTGLTGSNTFSGGAVPKTASGYAVWKGEWRLPD